MYVCMYVCMYLSIYLSICLSICLSIDLSIYRSIYLSSYLHDICIATPNSRVTTGHSKLDRQVRHLENSREIQSIVCASTYPIPTKVVVFTVILPLNHISHHGIPCCTIPV